MTRTGQRGAQAPVMILAIVLAALAAACGGGASASPGAATQPGGSTGPGTSAAPTEPATESQGPGESAATGDGGEAFTAATTALDGLDSYAFRVEFTSTANSSGTTTDSHTVMSGIVVNAPEKQSSLELTELDPDGTLTSDTTIVIIGDQAWTRDGGEDGTWIEIPASATEGFIFSMASFRPEQMFGLYFAGIGSDFQAVGTETKNGVSAIHYRGDEAVGALLGAIAGVQGSWTSDVWIATDGGFLVHSEAGAEAAAAGDSGSFMIVVDITDPNSAGPIEPPA